MVEAKSLLTVGPTSGCLLKGNVSLGSVKNGFSTSTSMLMGPCTSVGSPC